MRDAPRFEVFAVCALMSVLALATDSRLDALEVEQVRRADWQTDRLEVAFSAPPDSATLAETVVDAPGKGWPAVTLERSNVSGSWAVTYCPWPDSVSWIRATLRGVEVCAPYGDPPGPEPCAAFAVGAGLALIGDFALVLRAPDTEQGDTPGGGWLLYSPAVGRLEFTPAAGMFADKPTAFVRFDSIAGAVTDSVVLRRWLLPLDGSGFLWPDTLRVR